MVIVIKRIIILILLSFIIIPDTALAQDWWSHDYNERAEYVLAENGRMDRDENYVYFINLTGLSGKIQNCTSGIRATDMLGNEIKSLVFNEFFSDSAAGFCLALIKPGQKLSKGNNLSMIFYYNSYNEIDTDYSLNLTTPTLLHDDKFLTNGTWTLGDSSLITNRVYGKEGYELVGHNLSSGQSIVAGSGDSGTIFNNPNYLSSYNNQWGYYADWANVSCENALRNTDGNCYYGQRFWWRGDYYKNYSIINNNIYHLVSIFIQGHIPGGDKKAYIQENWGNYNVNSSQINLTSNDWDCNGACWKQYLVKGSFSTFGNYQDISYVGGVFFDLTNWNITITKIKQESLNNSSTFILSFSLPQTLQPNQNFHIYSNVKDISDTPVANLSSSDFKIFRDNEQINFTGFRNFNNGTYSLNASSGNIIGNISFHVEAGGASAEAFSSVMIKPKSNIVFIASDWENIFSSGLTGKPVFANYSETEKYYFGKIRPEQVFVFDNITTDYPTYRFKDKQAFLETFYSNDTAIIVSNKEQALAAAPYARLKSIPILLDSDEFVLKKFNSILNFSNKKADEISGIAIKEFSRAWKNINTIIITNPYSETSELAGALAAKHNSIIIPMNFSAISYPETVSDFYSLNSANGVVRIRAKINETIKKLSDNFLFSNSIDYKIGRIQLNLVLLGNVSEVPQPAIFDTGREMFFDYDSNYLLSDFPYADANGDGKADLITGRIVSPYQLIDLPKTNKIVTAALYRNLETVFSGNGLIESQATDTAFRTAGFETARLVENRTTLSYYELTFGFSNITDFLKSLFKEQSIMESLRLMDTIYSGYNELLEHNYYKMMNSLNLGWSGLTIKMFPDERLTKESLLGRMQNADGIFYYGLGDGLWQVETFGSGGIYFSEFPTTGSMVYDERTNSARLPDERLFEKGISAFVGSSGIIHDVYSFMPNAKFAQGIAGNKSIAASLEGSKYPLLPSQIKNLTASLKFNYEPRRDVAIKQFLQMVCYCDPEKKIDPDAQESGNNPAINQSATFKSRIRMPVNYFVSGGRIFFDTDQYLQEMGKPAIPIYSAETILPNGSRIIGIIFDYNSTKYENISADFVPIDEHFNDTAETVHEFYPSQMFYSETFDLLDGRKSVKLIAAGMQYNSGTKEALVLDGAEAAIEYSSPFEFVEFSAGNITSDKNQSFGINAAGENLSIVIDIRSGNFSETIEQKIPPGFSEINWAPPFRGEFSATAYILMENNSAGPRYAHFFVIPPAGFFGMFESFGANGYEKIMKSFSEKIRFAFNSAAAVIEYINPLEKFSSSANSSATKKQISSPDYSLSVAQDSGKIVYRMKDSRGELVLEKNAGATKETCKGDCSGLYAKINSGVSEMQSLQDYVVENIGK